MFTVREDSYDAMERFIDTDTAQTQQKYNSTATKAATPKDESELRINEYISLNSLTVLPSSHFRWEYFDMQIRFNNIYVEGKLAADKIPYKDQYELDKLLKEIEGKITSILKSQIDTYLHDYPNAEKAKIEIELEGRIVW